MDALKSSRLVLNAIVLGLVSACAGGGGGGGGGPPLVSPPPPPPVFPPLAAPHASGDYPDVASSEFTANWGPAGINAQVAWDNGATGAGVLVGVIDNGIHPEHPELSGRISPNSIDIRSGRNTLVTTNSHGSELSSLIAGNYNGLQTVGVAFDATILAIRADNGAGGFEANDLANAINYARQQGVDVINLSLGSAPPSAPVVEQAIRNATAAGVIFVVSAGNDGENGATRPNFPGFFANAPATSNGLIVIAGGLNSDGTVNSRSNPPGVVGEWYLTAPGWQVIVPDYGPAGPVPGFQQCGASAGLAPDLCRIQGTSYAAPHVAGAIALVKSAFPGLTPQQVVDLLLTTADDTGAPGIDDVNGRGRLNVGRAFEPVGPLSAPLMIANGMEFGDMAMLGGVGAAFGDVMSLNAASWTVAAFDDYNRTFPINFADNWVVAGAGPAHVAQAPELWRGARDANGVRMQIAFAEDPLPESRRSMIDRADLAQSAVRIDTTLAPGLTASLAAHGARTDFEREGDAVSHLGYVNPDLSLRLTKQLNDTLSLSLISESGDAEPSPFVAFSERSASAARASMDLERLGFDVTFGRINEDHGVLGLVWSGDLGQTPGGETHFAALGAHADLTPHVRTSLSAEFGDAELGQSGWLRVSEPLRTTAFSLEANIGMAPAWLSGEGSLVVSVSQPLRVEGGALTFMAPVATKYGRQSLSYEERSFDASPSGRELRFGLGYRYFSAENLSAFGEALYVIEPGHIAGAEPDAIFRFGIRAAH